MEKLKDLQLPLKSFSPFLTKTDKVIAVQYMSIVALIKTVKNPVCI